MPVNTPHTPLAPADETLGRFLSPDPVVQAPENTQNYNRYSYALNNPLNYTDPSGMSYAPHPDDERLYVNDLMAVYHGRNSGNMNLHAYNQWMYDMMDANRQWQYMGQQRFDNMYGVGAFSAMSSLHNFRNALNNSSYYHFTGAAAQSLFGMMKSAHKDGFNLYGVQAFGRLTIVSSLGDIGSTEFGQNGGIGFSNPTANAFMSAVEATNSGDGITGIPKSDVVSTLTGASAIPVNTIKGGFDAARVTQKTVSTWSKGARVLGRTSNILTAATVSYDFATGTANTSTLVNAGVAVVGAGVVFAVGIAAAPWVAAGGVVYGIVSLAGGDEWLNSQWDISDKINFINPSGQ